MKTLRISSMNDATNEPGFGHLESVDLREAWTSEDKDFTPWLAEPENLEILGEALGFDLKLESVERYIGSFRADIVCKDADTDNIVLIENQLEKTDHVHLGQLLTYAAGLQALTVVWVARIFQDEHRAAIDWLNEITHDKFCFFGLEIELWRIGDSLPAPKFNIVCMPNDWSRSVAPAVGGSEPSEKSLKQLEYWTVLQGVLDGTDGPVTGNRKARAKNWMDYGVGRTNFNLAANLNSLERSARVYLNINGENARQYLARLEEQKETIEEEIGYPLKWGAQKPGSRAKIIACYLDRVDLNNESDWPRQHEWLARHLNDMHRVFSRRIKDL